MKQKRKNITHGLIFGLLCATLAGCGGGGGDSPNQSQNPTQQNPSSVTAEGFWSGTLSNNGASGNYSMAVLENGNTWLLGTSGIYLLDAGFGHTTSGSSQLSGSLNLYYPAQNSVTYTGSFVPKSSLNARFSSGATYTASYDTSYDQSASLAALAGSYTGNEFSFLGSSTTTTQNLQVIISSSGAITMPSQPANGCSASGTVQPRASGKNVFDVTLHLQGGCALGNNVTLQGEAVYNTTTHILWVMALNSAQTQGFFYGATKNI